MEKSMLLKTKERFLKESVEEIICNPDFYEEFTHLVKDEEFEKLVYWAKLLKEKKPVFALQSIIKTSSMVLPGEENEFQKFSENIDLDGIIYNFCVVSQQLSNPTKEAVEEYTHRELLEKAQSDVMMETSALLVYLDERLAYSGVGFSLADRIGWNEPARMKTLRTLDMDLSLRRKKEAILREKVEKAIHAGVQEIARRDVFSPQSENKPENILFKENFFGGLIHEMDNYYGHYTRRFEQTGKDDLIRKLQRKIEILVSVIEKFKKYQLGFENQKLEPLSRPHILKSILESSDVKIITGKKSSKEFKSKPQSRDRSHLSVVKSTVPVPEK